MGRGTNLLCIYHMVPYTDLGGRWVFRRLTSLLYCMFIMVQCPNYHSGCMARKVHLLGYQGYCLLTEREVIVCFIVLVIHSDAWTSWQIRKIAGCACAGNAGNVFPASAGKRSDMHHGTCVMHVPWYMPGSLTRGLLWSRWRRKRSRCMRNLQFYVSDKRPVTMNVH